MSGGKRKPLLTKEWKQRIGLYGGILLVLIVASVIPRVYNQQKSIELAVPTQDVSYGGSAWRYTQEAQAQPFASMPRMTDPDWKSEPIPPTGFTIGEAGSLQCVLAIDAPEPVTPRDVNARLTAAEAFTDTGGIYWDRVNEALAPMRYTYHEKAQADVVLSALSEGKSAMVKVADDQMNALWLYVEQARDGDYVAYNPQSNAYDAVLADHGRVYGVLIGERVAE
jgi:hypothetical protein